MSIISPQETMPRLRTRISANVTNELFCICHMSSILLQNIGSLVAKNVIYYPRLVYTSSANRGGLFIGRSYDQEPTYVDMNISIYIEIHSELLFPNDDHNKTDHNPIINTELTKSREYLLPNDVHINLQGADVANTHSDDIQL